MNWNPGESTEQERRLRAAFAPPAFDHQRAERVLGAARGAGARKPGPTSWAAGLAKGLAVAAAVVVVAVVSAVGGRMLLASGLNLQLPWGPTARSTASSASTHLKSGAALPFVPLATGLAQMQRPLALPDVRVAGEPDAVVVNHGPHKANSLWLHYPTGIRLIVSPQPFDARADVARAASMTHPDGSPYVHLERIAGRDTAVVTEGEVLQDKRATPFGSGGNAVIWGANGYTYGLTPMSPPHPATLASLLKVAASVPNAPPKPARAPYVWILAGVLALLAIAAIGITLARRRDARPI